MRLPYLRGGGKSSAVSERLGGLCLIDEYRNGSLADGLRLASDGSPGLTQRTPPGLVKNYASPQGLFASSGGLVVIAGENIYFKGYNIGTVSEGEKMMAEAGGKVVIFPDKKYIDIEDSQLQLRTMEITVSKSGMTFDSGSLTMETGTWPFSVGDAVEISGCVDLPVNNMTIIVRAVDGKKLIFDDNLFDAGVESGKVTVKRKVPDFEAICESGNRLWGCVGDTIYSSKLGDPLNFFVYDGLSTDSYALKVGGTGGFTACRPYGSHIIFFKEDMAFRLYGTRPANYQIMAARIPGVRAGCWNTVCVDNEDMYYLGVDGAYAYSGGVPQLLTFDLGGIPADRACGGVWKGRYYLSYEKDGAGRTLSYDITRQQWLPWGSEVAMGMALSGGRMYLLERGGDLLALDEGRGDEEWSAEFRPFKDLRNRHGAALSLIIDARPEDGAWLAVDVRTGRGPWYQAAIFDSGKRGVRPIPVIPNRTEGVTVRLRGRGRCPIVAVERVYREGSEV